jgi:hypothetical protein
LEALVVKPLGDVADVNSVLAAQGDGIARLKRLNGRAVIKPSGMVKGTEPTRGGKRAKVAAATRRRHGSPWRPSCRGRRRGPRFEGDGPCQVRDPVLAARVERHRRVRWLTPAGDTIVAPLPGGTPGDTGRDCRDAFLGLAKTRRKPGIGFWDDIGATLGVQGGPTVPPVPHLIRCHAAPA